MIDELEVLVSSSTSSLVLYQAMIAGGLALTLHMTVKVVSPPLMLMSPAISISLGGTIEHEKEELNVSKSYKYKVLPMLYVLTQYIQCGFCMNCVAISRYTALIQAFLYPLGFSDYQNLASFPKFNKITKS